MSAITPRTHSTQLYTQASQPEPKQQRTAAPKATTEDRYAPLQQAELLPSSSVPSASLFRLSHFSQIANLPSTSLPESFLGLFKDKKGEYGIQSVLVGAALIAGGIGAIAGGIRFTRQAYGRAMQENLVRLTTERFETLSQKYSQATPKNLDRVLTEIRNALKDLGFTEENFLRLLNEELPSNASAEILKIHAQKFNITLEKEASAKIYAKIQKLFLQENEALGTLVSHLRVDPDYVRYAFDRYHIKLADNSYARENLNASYFLRNAFIAATQYFEKASGRPAPELWGIIRGTLPAARLPQELSFLLEPTYKNSFILEIQNFYKGTAALRFHDFALMTGKTEAELVALVQSSDNFVTLSGNAFNYNIPYLELQKLRAQADRLQLQLSEAIHNHSFDPEIFQEALLSIGHAHTQRDFMSGKISAAEYITRLQQAADTFGVDTDLWAKRVVSINAFLTRAQALSQAREAFKKNPELRELIHLVKLTREPQSSGDVLQDVFEILWSKPGCRVNAVLFHYLGESARLTPSDLNDDIRQDLSAFVRVVFHYRALVHRSQSQKPTLKRYEKYLEEVALTTPYSGADFSHMLLRTESGGSWDSVLYGLSQNVDRVFFAVKHGEGREFLALLTPDERDLLFNQDNLNMGPTSLAGFIAQVSQFPQNYRKAYLQELTRTFSEDPREFVKRITWLGITSEYKTIESLAEGYENFLNFLDKHVREVMKEAVLEALPKTSNLQTQALRDFAQFEMVQTALKGKEYHLFFHYCAKLIANPSARPEEIAAIEKDVKTAFIQAPENGLIELPEVLTRYYASGSLPIVPSTLAAIRMAAFESFPANQPMPQPRPPVVGASPVFLSLRRGK